MKKLVILRGIMGSGKSYFIKERNLEEYTLSTDKLRFLFNASEMTIDYREAIPQYNNKKVWDLLYGLLEDRMKKGEFTIIDAMHIYSDEIYKRIARLSKTRDFRAKSGDDSSLNDAAGAENKKKDDKQLAVSVFVL